MRFPVLTEEELNPIPYEPGEYWFTVKGVEEKESKTNNPMFKIQLAVDFGHGKLLIYDYLVFTRESSWKIHQFCKSIGKPELYKSGNMEKTDILNQQGRARVDYEINKENGRKYLRIKSYLDLEIENNQGVQIEEELNDDVPF